MMRFAPENCVVSVSENFNSIFAGAGPWDLSAGELDNSAGWANAAVVANKAEATARVALEKRFESVMNNPMQWE